MDKDNSQYALVTGGSKGIGKSIAVELAKKGYNLLLIARNGEELATVATELVNDYKVQVNFLVIDLTAASAAASIYDWVSTAGYTLAIVVNNAGYGVWGNFKSLSLKDQLNMMQVNMNVVVLSTICGYCKIEEYADSRFD